MKTRVFGHLAIFLISVSFGASASQDLFSSFDEVLSGESDLETNCNRVLEKAVGDGLPSIPKNTRAFLETLQIPDRSQVRRDLKVSPETLSQQIQFLIVAWEKASNHEEINQVNLYPTLRLAMRLEQANLEYYGSYESKENERLLTQLRDAILHHQRYVRLFDPNRKVDAFVAHGVSVRVLGVLAQLKDRHFSVQERLKFLRDLDFEMIGLVDDDSESLLNWNDSPWAPIFFAQLAPLIVEAVLSLRNELLKSKSVDFVADTSIASSLSSTMKHVLRLKTIASNEGLTTDIIARSLARIKALQQGPHYRALQLRFSELFVAI